MLKRARVVKPQPTQPQTVVVLSGNEGIVEDSSIIEQEVVPMVKQIVVQPLASTPARSRKQDLATVLSDQTDELAESPSLAQPATKKARLEEEPVLAVAPASVSSRPTRAAAQKAAVAAAAAKNDEEDEEEEEQVEAEEEEPAAEEAEAESQEEVTDELIESEDVEPSQEETEPTPAKRGRGRPPRNPPSPTKDKASPAAVAPTAAAAAATTRPTRATRASAKAPPPPKKGGKK